MGGGGTETTTQTSGLANKELDTAVSTIGSKLNTALGSGQKVFGESMYAGISPETRGAALSLTKNPLTGTYSDSIGATMRQQGDIAQGNVGNDPLRNRIIDDVTANTNATFNASGRFGGASNQETLTENLVGALAPFDYGRQQTAIENLPGLYTASNAPASAALTGGQILDADLQAVLSGRADLFDRTQNAGWNDLARGTGILAASAPSGGTTTSTTTPTAPWWQQVGGYVLGNAGNAMRMGF